MQRTLPALSFRCPSMPTSGMIKWREYRLISSFVRFGTVPAPVSAAAGAETAPVAAPPATDGIMLTVSFGDTGVCSFCRYRMSSSLT